MTEAVSSRITRLNQLLSGKTSGKKVPLLDKETLLDAFVALYNECNTDYMSKDKNISTYVKKFKPLICEIEKLRLRKSDFEIKKTIGRGHFGEVHVVREKITGNVYAMKVLKKSETLSQDNVAFFEEERDIMAFACNPWITSLQYAFQDFESLYLVMDFHPGGDLLSLLAKYDDIFEENVAQFYLAEMIMAMHAVHILGYVHRDIKPENVLIDRTGHIKLADFGSSAKLSSAKMVVSKMPVGTPEYIAPEVLTSMDGSRSGGKYGIECDWWSLGVVAYEMMVGVTPFQADSVVVVYSQIMNFKNSLKFPDDQPLTDNAKDLIRSLLTDQKHRIGYTELAKHLFFTGLDWTTLQDAVPPYVPTVQREDDTSNFDDFETESSGPRIDNFMEEKKGFNGKDLPFIGFTFTKQLTIASLNESLESVGPASGIIKKRSSTKRESAKDIGNHQLIALRLDIEKEQKKNKEYKLVLEDKLRMITKVENERNQLETEKAVFNTIKRDLKRLYEKEKLKRENLEQEIFSLRKEMNETSEKTESILNEKIHSSNEQNKELIQQLEQEKTSLILKMHHLEVDLNDSKKSLDDSKIRVGDLQAKLSKVNEDTKTNVTDLQQKLRKVTMDNENRIKKLQEKLAKGVLTAQSTASQLENIEKEKEDLETELLEFQVGNKDLRKELLEKNLENAKLNADLRGALEELGDSRTRYDKLVDFGEELKAQVERKLEKLQKEALTTRKELKLKEEEFKKIKEEQAETKDNLNSKESVIATLEATCNDLQSQLEELADVKELSSKELDEKDHNERTDLTRRLSEINIDKWKIENENITLKSDLRDHKFKIEELEASLKNMNKQYEEFADNSEASINNLKKEVSKVCEENKRYHKEILYYQENNEKLESDIDLLKVEVSSKNGTSVKFKDVEEKFEKAKVTIDNLKTDKKALESKLRQITDELSKIRREKEQYQEELNEKDRQANSQDLTIQMLKQTCTMLEGQVEELEVMNDEYQDRETTWNVIKRQQNQAQEQVEQQLNDALASLEQQRLLKNQALEKLRLLEENRVSFHEGTQKKIEQLEVLTKKQEEKIQELTIMLSEAEQISSFNAVTIRNLERKIAEEIETKEKIVSEINHLEDISAQQTSSNFQLTVEIEQLREQNDEILNERDCVQNQLEINKSQHVEEKIKLDSTIAQQTKLIDFLQKKVMLDDKSFGAAKKTKGKGGKGKLDHIPIENTADMRKTRDLERALEKEKNTNLQHHLQLQKAREELTSLRQEMQHYRMNTKTSSNPTTPRMGGKLEFRKISNSTISLKAENSPSTSVADIYNMTDPEVGCNGFVSTESRNPSSNPHRLQATLNMRPSKCPVCLNTIHFAKQALKCSECQIIVHSKCASSLHNLCGVPKSLSGHFNLNISRSSMILDDGTVAIDITGASKKLPKIEGMLKFPRKSGMKQGWEKKWVILKDGKLSIYDNENSIEFDPFDEINLNIKDGELNIHSAIPSSELIWVNGSDIHFVFSVEIIPYTLGWPRRTLYFLAETFTDKQKWVAALEYVADEVRKATQKEDHGMVKDVILTLEGSKHLDLNCAALLNETGGVLGSEAGLYVVSLKSGGHQYKPVQVIGLGPVYQLKVIQTLELLLLITGKDRLFCYIALKDLENRLRQLQTGSSVSALTSYQIERVKSCHLFKYEKMDSDHYVCAVTTHKLNIFQFDLATQSFALKKELETNESASCFLFTSTSIIYGTSKFHTVDLKTYQRRDFLDASDTSLAFAIFGTAQRKSFPISIFKVSARKPRDEYLLCFSEFGMFVDWQGRRSRKGDLKWSRLPMAFEYHHPHLYVTHFGSIEICEISTDVKFDISATPRRFVDVPDPRFIGEGLIPDSVLFASIQKTKLEIICHKPPPLIGLSRNMSISGVSITSSANVANAILEQSNTTFDPMLQRSPSNNSICSDEETSINIGKNQLTPVTTRRENTRNETKDKNRYSFRFMFKGNRKSHYDG